MPTAWRTPTPDAWSNTCRMRRISETSGGAIGLPALLLLLLLLLLVLLLPVFTWGGEATRAAQTRWTSSSDGWYAAAAAWGVRAW